MENYKISDFLKLSKFDLNFYNSINRDDISKKLTEYNFYIQLSDFEGMAMSVLESMSLGLIPVVTNVGEISNYGRHKLNSFIIEREDNIQMACHEFYNLSQSDCLLEKLSCGAIETAKEYKDFRLDFIDKLISIITKSNV